jgi:nucleoside-diphosphate-sugar epimerase
MSCCAGRACPGIVGCSRSSEDKFVNERTILVTGSSGLIGTALIGCFNAKNIACLGLDLRSPEPADRIDIRDTARLIKIVSGVAGIVHLAAVSRVIDGERDAALCQAVNVVATGKMLDAALALPRRPWVIYASSREVYGQQDSFPVSEDAKYRPLNTYARSKVDAECLVEEARKAGLQTAILRFSTVYGSVDDHVDRVVPAFVAAAVRGGTLRVDGEECELDATHVNDVALGICRVVDVLLSGESRLPPIHFVSGQPVSLLGLAKLANEIGGSKGRIVTTTPRTFDVSKFVGNPERARQLLGWEATTDLRTGLAQLARDFVQCVR